MCLVCEPFNGMKRDGKSSEDLSCVSFRPVSLSSLDLIRRAMKTSSARAEAAKLLKGRTFECSLAEPDDN